MTKGLKQVSQVKAPQGKVAEELNDSDNQV